MTQRKPLTPKQAKLIKLRAQGKTVQQAGIEAGYGNTPESSRTIASEVLRNPTIQQALHEEMARQGITLAAIVKPITDGLAATRTVIIRDKGATNTESSDNSAFADEVPDHAIRLKSSGMAAQFLGIGKSTGDVTINFISKANEQRDVYDL